MASGLYQNRKPNNRNRRGITGNEHGLWAIRKWKAQQQPNRLGITGQKTWPLGFTKMKSPAAAIKGWVSQDKKNGLWVFRKWKAQQQP